MRVELPQLSPKAGAPSAGSTGSASTARRRRPLHELLILAVTCQRVAIPILGLCIALLGWALLIRAPQGRKALVVMARSSPSARDTNAAITTEMLTALKQQQSDRSQSLIRERKEVPPILSRLELRAQELGCTLERALRPPVTAPHGLTNLTLHPVALHLTIPPGLTPSSFHQFTQWLREISTLPQRCEIAHINVVANGQGLSGADLVLHFYSDNQHAEVSPK